MPPPMHCTARCPFINTSFELPCSRSSLVAVVSVGTAVLDYGMVEFPIRVLRIPALTRLSSHSFLRLAAEYSPLPLLPSLLHYSRCSLVRVPSPFYPCSIPGAACQRRCEQFLPAFTSVLCMSILTERPQFRPDCPPQHPQRATAAPVTIA